MENFQEKDVLDEIEEELDQEEQPFEEERGSSFPEDPAVRKALLTFSVLSLVNTFVAISIYTEPPQEEIETFRLVYGTITCIAYIPVVPILISYAMDLFERRGGEISPSTRLEVQEILTTSETPLETSDLVETPAD